MESDTTKVRNNAQVGMTAQKIICDKYEIVPNAYALHQFEANYNKKLVPQLEVCIDAFFNDINIKPIECLTFSSKKGEKKMSPHNFVLENGKTLSIRTSTSSGKVAPRVIGQCGLDTFNSFFGSIVDCTAKDKNDIKKIIYDKINLMLPLFIDYVFVSDITLFLIWEGDKYRKSVIETSKMSEFVFKKKDFTFSRKLKDWNESITLRYKKRSLAEIQIHKKRTFKFRFIIKELIKLILEEKTTTETLGITAEKTICDLFKLSYPDNLKERAVDSLQKELTPICKSACALLPKPVRYTGSEKGERGGESKCSYDFVLEGGKTMSLKTNTGRMVCPPEVGQPGADTCYLYFKDYIKEDHVNGDIFKRMVLENIDSIFPIYINHLFDSDYLLWIFKKSKIEYRVFEINFAKGVFFKKEGFSFTKKTVDEWNESNTLKYNGVSIGEFQVHKSRDCYKFRFNLENFTKIVENFKGV